jgi:hypothetical protein
MKNDVIYMEYSNGKLEYWIHSDGQRIYVNPRWVRSEMKAGARLVNLGERNG